MAGGLCGLPSWEQVCFGGSAQYCASRSDFSGSLCPSSPSRNQISYKPSQKVVSLHFEYFLCNFLVFSLDLELLKFPVSIRYFLPGVVFTYSRERSLRLASDVQRLGGFWNDKSVQLRRHLPASHYANAVSWHPLLGASVLDINQLFQNLSILRFNLTLFAESFQCRNFLFIFAVLHGCCVFCRNLGSVTLLDLLQSSLVIVHVPTQSFLRIYFGYLLFSVRNISVCLTSLYTYFGWAGYFWGSSPSDSC